MDCIELTKKLINFPSLTPLSSGCIEYIADLLESYGFESHIIKFGSGAEEVTNLYAVIGNGAPNICFAGHIDVVPTGPLDQWKYPPFEATIEGDKLYGRGAVDMKAAIAAMIVASRDFLSNGKLNNGSISFLITSDEEGPARHGTKPMMQWLRENNHKLDFCILGEPTYQSTFGDVIQIGRRGSISFILEIHGLQGHVAYDNFINPNVIAIKALHELINLELDSGSEVFVPSKLNITSIDAQNSTTNIIPNKIVVRFNVRFNDKQTPEGLKQKCENIIAKFTDNFELRLAEPNSTPFISDANDKNVQLFHEVVKKLVGTAPKFTTYGGVSDGRFIREMCQVAEFGLASGPAHQINEHLFIEDLENLCRIYKEFLLQCFIVK